MQQGRNKTRQQKGGFAHDRIKNRRFENIYRAAFHGRDGRIRQGYYSDEELEKNRIEELSSWKALRPFCYSLIKGKKLPESFQITMQLSPEENEKFIRRVKPDFPAEQVAALYLNIRYENHAAACVTGTSLKVFTLDKQIEREWDDTVRRYFKKLQIPCVEAN